MRNEPGILSSLSNYKMRILKTIDGFDPAQVQVLVGELMSAREAGSSVYIAGNGGSASTASHFAVDWMLGTDIQHPSLRVLAINESIAGITATGNDRNFDDIFLRPIAHLCQEGDVLVVVSASGNSANLIKAALVAQSKGATVVAITGFDGGKLRALADISVHVGTEVGDYGVAEDVHMMVGHMVKEALIVATAGASSPPLKDKAF
jgi:D-sedoheptulose 7-phosphate isomerase